MSHLSSEHQFDLESVAPPMSVREASENLRKLTETSRRSFLHRGLAASAIPAALVAASSKSASASSSSNGPFPSYVQGSTQRYFQEIQADEASHVTILVTAINYLGGTHRPFPVFKGITISDPHQFLSMSVAFENTGVHAYFGAAPAIQNASVASIATSIALVEAYHSGFLNTLANQAIVPGGVTYATPYTLDQVVSAVSPFIADLNDGGKFPVGFSSTPSHQNDIDILNTALLLEYLEAAFYFYSVPRVFSKSH